MTPPHVGCLRVATPTPEQTKQNEEELYDVEVEVEGRVDVLLRTQLVVLASHQHLSVKYQHLPQQNNLV